ncbi:hypothetical protein EYF80_046427 [Liparis tanakae]|uniref:Uncharacterized protein n=1 Tax=Liparis tanakae TaxID=230148 RepID=A0A4Z2FQF4_9TELE|nr:hypothetical protein EYF80_046427 [Liparis tanakae]
MDAHSFCRETATVFTSAPVVLLHSTSGNSSPAPPLQPSHGHLPAQQHKVTAGNRRMASTDPAVTRRSHVSLWRDTASQVILPRSILHLAGSVGAVALEGSKVSKVTLQSLPSHVAFLPSSITQRNLSFQPENNCKAHGNFNTIKQPQPMWSELMLGYGG